MGQNATNVETALVNAVETTLESMVFHQAEYIGNSITDEDTGAEKIWAVIPIYSPIEGEFLLEVTKDYAREVTASVYGMVDEKETDDAATYDAIAELVNTIAGRFIQELIPQEQEFALGLPKTGTGSTPPDDLQVVSLSFSVDENVIRAVVSGDDFNKFID